MLGCFTKYLSIYSSHVNKHVGQVWNTPASPDVQYYCVPVAEYKYNFTLF